MVLPTINGELNFRRKLITIDGSKVTSETGIPLGLNVNLPGVDSTGKDVRLAKLDGTPIAREIECVGVPNAEDVMIWYPFDTIAATNSQFWVYWGNTSLDEPAADSTYGSENVWDANYVGVWLMNNDPNGDAANSIKDSTSYDNHGTPAGSMTTADLVDSYYGKGIDFEGTNDYIRIPHNAEMDLVNLLTLETMQTADTDTFKYIAGIYSTSTIYKQFVMMGKSSGIAIFGKAVASSYYTAGDKITTGTYSNTIDSLECFVNGASRDSDALAGPLNSPNFDFLIGARHGATNPDAQDFWNGIIRMVRLSNIVRSDDYIITTHANLYNPTATGTTPFYLLFSEPMHQRRVPQFM